MHVCTPTILQIDHLLVTSDILFHGTVKLALCISMLSSFVQSLIQIGQKLVEVAFSHQPHNMVYS